MLFVKYDDIQRNSERGRRRRNKSCSSSPSPVSRPLNKFKNKSKNNTSALKRPRRAIPSIRTEQADSQPDLHCPIVTSQIGNILHLAFPIIGIIPCTERGSSYRTVQAPWFRKKGNLKKQLERAHKMEFKGSQVQNWCILCMRKLSNNKIVFHQCFKDLREAQGHEVNYQMLTPEEYESMPFKCTKCTEFASDNKRALNSHFRIHNENRNRPNSRPIASKFSSRHK